MRAHQHLKQYPVWLEGMGTTRDILRGDDNTCAVAIVGGSFSGLSSAYRLIEKGLNPTGIVILDRSYVGEAAGRSAGQLAKSTEEDYLDSINKANYEATNASTRRMWNSQKEGIDTIERMTREGGVNCGFERNGSKYFMRRGDPKSLKYLEDEARIRNENGFPCELRVDQRLGENGIYLYDKTDASIKPARFASELSKRLEGRGVRIYENSGVEKFDKGNMTLYTPAGSVKAGKVIFSGQNIPVQFIKGTVPSLVIETYCFATEPLTEEQIKEMGMSDRALFWDGNMPYVYGRMTDDNRLLVGGHDLLLRAPHLKLMAPGSFPLIGKKLSERKMDQLRRRADDYFPQLSDVGREYEWKGSLHVATDFMPVIGNEGDVHYSGYAPGIPHAVLSGEMVSQHAMGEKTEYDDLFEAGRKMPTIPTIAGGAKKNAMLWLQMAGY